MSIGHFIYDIIDAGKTPLKIDMQHQQTLPDDVLFRKYSAEEIFGPNAKFIFAEKTDDIEWTPNTYTTQDLDFWTNTLYCVNQGKYFVAQHRGIDTIEYDVIIARLADNDPLLNVIECNYRLGPEFDSKYDEKMFCQKGDALEIWRDLLKPDSGFRRHQWHGKVAFKVNWNRLTWYFTDINDSVYWKLSLG